MPTTSVVFDPEISDRALDREVRDVNRAFEDSASDIDISASADGMRPPGAGGGGGGFAAAGGSSLLAYAEQRNDILVEIRERLSEDFVGESGGGGGGSSVLSFLGGAASGWLGRLSGLASGVGGGPGVMPGTIGGRTGGSDGEINLPEGGIMGPILDALGLSTDGGSGPVFEDFAENFDPPTDQEILDAIAGSATGGISDLQNIKITEPNWMGAFTNWQWPSTPEWMNPFTDWSWPSTPEWMDPFSGWSWPSTPDWMNPFTDWSFPDAPGWMQQFIKFGGGGSGVGGGSTSRSPQTRWTGQDGSTDTSTGNNAQRPRVELRLNNQFNIDPRQLQQEIETAAQRAAENAVSGLESEFRERASDAGITAAPGGRFS